MTRRCYITCNLQKIKILVIERKSDFTTSKQKRAFESYHYQLSLTNVCLIPSKQLPAQSQQWKN